MAFKPRLTGVVSLFTTAAFLLISVRSEAAEVPISPPDEPTKTSQSVPVDPYRDLFPGASGAGGQEQAMPNVVNQAPTPIYESWDVLRQYPRTTPIPKSTLDEKLIDK